MANQTRDFQRSRGYLYYALLFLAVGLWHAWDGWNTPSKVIQKKTDSALTTLADYETYNKARQPGEPNKYPKVRDYVWYNRITAFICLAGFVVCGYVYFIVK